MKMKTYNINGVEYTQDFLCISEIISVYQLIEDVFPEGEIDILNFTKELEQSGKILRFLNIICFLYPGKTSIRTKPIQLPR